MLCNTTMMDTYQHPFVKILRMYKTKREPYCKLWTFSDNAMSCQFISCYKCTTTLVQDVDGGEVVRMGILYFLLSFALNLKLLFKNITLIIK